MIRNIRDYMMRDPYIIEPDKGAKEALEILRELDIRHFPVVGRDSKIVGIVSERDLRAAVAMPAGSTLLVGDVMKSDVHYVTTDTPLRDAIVVMAEQKLGCTVVVNRKEEVVGIFTTTDALNMLANLIEDSSMSQLFYPDDYRPLSVADF